MNCLNKLKTRQRVSRSTSGTTVISSRRDSRDLTLYILGISMLSESLMMNCIFAIIKKARNIFVKEKRR